MRSEGLRINSFCKSVAAALLLLALPGAVSAVTLETVATGFKRPVSFAFAPDGSGRKFIVQQGGVIRVLSGDTVLPTPFLDISSKITATNTSGEQGLLCLAFHPNFRANGRFFVYYSDVNADVMIEEYRASAVDGNIADVTSARKILRIKHRQYASHYGGQMQFGPDGYLYIGTGDAGVHADPLRTGQNLQSLMGKVLRIDVDRSTRTRRYRIPRNNPYFNKRSRRAEIWAYGFRNPWRFSFDRGTGRLFLGDVGQDMYEEINLVNRGGNYGWSKMEGAHCFDRVEPNCTMKGKVLPIAEYTHDEGRAVVAGYVYRGQSIPELYGKFVFGDFAAGTVWTLTEKSNGTWLREPLISTNSLISSFGEDENGELYLLDIKGKLFRFRL